MLKFPVQRPYELPATPSYHSSDDGWVLTNDLGTDDGTTSMSGSFLSDRSDYVFSLSNGQCSFAPSIDYDPQRLGFKVMYYGVALSRKEEEAQSTKTINFVDQESVSPFVVKVSASVDGEVLSRTSDKMLHSLDMRSGVATHTLNFCTSDGGLTVTVSVRVVVLITTPDLFAIHAKVEKTTGRTTTMERDSPDVMLKVVLAADETHWMVSSLHTLPPTPRHQQAASTSSFSEPEIFRFEQIPRSARSGLPVVMTECAVTELHKATPKPQGMEHPTGRFHPGGIYLVENPFDVDGSWARKRRTTQHPTGSPPLSTNNESGLEGSGHDSHFPQDLDGSFDPNSDPASISVLSSSPTGSEAFDRTAIEVASVNNLEMTFRRLPSSEVPVYSSAATRSLPAAACAASGTTTPEPKSPVAVAPFDELVKLQALQLRSRWDQMSAEVRLQDETHPRRLHVALRYSLFQMITNAEGCGSGVGLTKSGLSGHGGDSGQVAFNAQLFHSLFLTFTAPDLAKKQLEWILSALPLARKLAQRLSLPYGAIYPLQTITEPECGSYFLGSTARLHINGDIAYLASLFLECQSTELDFQLQLLGLMIETALPYLLLGHWDKGGTVFQMDSVTGPDAYNALVEADFYTNGIAKVHLNAIVMLRNKLRRQDEARVSQLLSELDVTEETMSELESAGEGIVLVRDDCNGVYYSHRHFDTLPLWDHESKPLQFPLSQSYHPLVIYRHSFCQLPSVLLGMLIFPNFERRLNNFEMLDLRRNLTYYEKRTTHDIPESLAVMSAMQFKAYGDFGRGTEGFANLLALDLDNTMGQGTDDPLSLVAMSSSWFVLAFGICALRVEDGTVTLSPALPVGWAKASVRITFQGATIQVSVLPTVIRYELLQGSSFRLIHFRTTRIHLYHDDSALPRSPIRTTPTVPMPNVAGAPCPLTTAVVNPSVVEVPRFVQQQVTGHFDGVIFQLDSLVEGFGQLQFECWRDVIDTLIARRGIPNAEPLTLTEWASLFCCSVAYETERMEARQYGGLDTVLKKRGIEIPLGAISDAEIVVTRLGLANAKVALLAERIQQKKLQFINGVMDMLWDLRRLGLRVAVVSHTRTLTKTLDNIGVLPTLFAALLDGNEAREKKLRGRPYTDIYEKAATKMHLSPDRCVLFSTNINQDFSLESLSRFRAVVNVVDAQLPSVRPLSDAEVGDTLTLKSVSAANFPASVSALEDLLLPRRTRDEKKISLNTVR